MPERPSAARRAAALPLAVLAGGLVLTLALGGAATPAAGQFGTTTTRPPTGNFGPPVPPSYGPPSTNPAPGPETTTPEGPPSPEVPLAPETTPDSTATTAVTAPPTTEPAFVPPTGLTRAQQARQGDQESDPLVLKPETSSMPWVVFFLIVALFAAAAFGAMWWLATRRWPG